MTKTIATALTGLLLSVCPPVQADSICYGQHVPICSLGMTPICICTGPTGQDCKYVCMPKR